LTIHKVISSNKIQIVFKGGVEVVEEWSDFIFES